MVQLKLYTYDQWGNEISTLWSFTPLLDEDQYDIYRETAVSASGTLRRRPISEQEIRLLTLGAGLLIVPANWQNFRRMLRAHKILWLRAVGSASNMQWIEYKLDQQEVLAFDHPEDVLQLRRIQITLHQALPLDFTQFEQTSAQLADSIGND